MGGLLDDERLHYREALQGFEVFPKPYTAAELLQKVKDVLSKPRSEALRTVALPVDAEIVTSGSGNPEDVVPEDEESASVLPDPPAAAERGETPQPAVEEATRPAKSG